MAQTTPTQQQNEVLQLTNQDRVLAGLQPLSWDSALADAATAHARAMAAAGILSHQLSGEPPLVTRASAAGAHFSAVAENVAYGPTPGAIEREWMHSVPHRQNILDPRMNAIGIGIVASGGTLWAVEDFAATVANDAPVPVEHIVEAPLKAHGLAIAAPGSPQAEAAQVACPQFEGTGGAHARFTVRWESARINQLPQPLADAVASRQYSLAAIATCPATNQRNSGFAVYRVAVLLF